MTPILILAMALAGTGLPAMALFIAGLYRREDEADRTSPGKVTRTTSSYRPAPAQPGVVMHTTETIRDDGIRDALRAVARHRLRSAQGGGYAVAEDMAALIRSVAIP